MNTQCTWEQMGFHAFGRREVVGNFDGGRISSDGGAMPLRETEQRTGILARVAAQFTDHRDPVRRDHSVRELISQRVLALALGYEDLNDHDTLNADGLLAVLVGKADPTSQDRARERDRGKPLASSSTLNRLELTRSDASAAERYKKIVAHPAGLDRLPVDVLPETYAEPASRQALYTGARADKCLDLF